MSVDKWLIIVDIMLNWRAFLFPVYCTVRFDLEEKVCIVLLQYVQQPDRRAFDEQPESNAKCRAYWAPDKFFYEAPVLAVGK